MAWSRSFESVNNVAMSETASRSSTVSYPSMCANAGFTASKRPFTVERYTPSMTFSNRLRYCASLWRSASSDRLRSMAIAASAASRAHQFEVPAEGAARLPEIQRDRAEHAAIRCTDRRRPASPQPGFDRRRAQVLPERVARDFRDDYLAVQEDRGGARTVARTDLEAPLRVQVVLRQAHAGHVVQRVGLGFVDRYRAERVRGDLLGRFRDGFERGGQVGIARDSFEDAPIARRQQFAALAFGDVDDAAANETPARGRQADEADFAGNVVPECVAVQPFETRRVAGERTIDVATGDAERRRAILLQRGTDLFRTHGQQFIARHLEKAHGVFVALDEPAGIHVEHDDGLRRVLDQGAIAGFALANRRFRRLACGGFTHADDEELAAVEPHLAHADFGVEQVAVPVPARGLAWLQVGLGVLDGCRHFLERLDDVGATRQ